MLSITRREHEGVVIGGDCLVWLHKSTPEGVVLLVKMLGYEGAKAVLQKGLSYRLPHGIKLHVQKHKNKKAQFGFEGPREVRILRKEVYDKIEKQLESIAGQK